MMNQGPNDVGYRYEHSIVSENDAIEVIKFEIGELENTDIIIYSLNNFNSFLSNATKKVADALLTLDTYNKTLEPLAGVFADYLIKDLNSHFKKNFEFAVWLCDTKEDTYNNYSWLGSESETKEEFISNFNEWKKGFKISDLGTEGSLYIYTVNEFAEA